jgi:transcriptional regulator with XRE-family HTH domain
LQSQPDTQFANLGRALSLLRELRGLSQAQVARQAGIGKSQLSKYENHKELPKLDSLEKILNVLSIGYLEFFYTMRFIDRRKTSLGQEEASDAFVLAGLSDDVTGGFETAFLVLTRLQRRVWEEALTLGPTRRLPLWLQGSEGSTEEDRVRGHETHAS